jgi:phosphoribosylcarboxyaminoimidazole (NCAIR) mutase
LFTVALLAVNDATLAQKLADFRRSQVDAVEAMRLPPAK